MILLAPSIKKVSWNDMEPITPLSIQINNRIIENEMIIFMLISVDL